MGEFLLRPQLIDSRVVTVSLEVDTEGLAVIHTAESAVGGRSYPVIRDTLEGDGISGCVVFMR
jgi:hypothetical protein